MLVSVRSAVSLVCSGKGDCLGLTAASVVEPGKAREIVASTEKWSLREQSSVG